MTRNHPWTRIITNEKDGFLHHLIIRIFNVLKRIKASFEKYCNKSNVFDLVISGFAMGPFELPCSYHAKDVLAYMIHYYLKNGMQKFIKTAITEQKKTNLNQKKLGLSFTINYYYY